MPLTEIQLMDKAHKKYRLLVTRGNWEAPTAQDAKITALEAVERSNERVTRI